MAAMMALASSAGAGEDFGDIENIDIEKVMNDEASWRTIYECLMDKAPCGDFQKLRGKLVFAWFVQVRKIVRLVIIYNSIL